MVLGKVPLYWRSTVRRHFHADPMVESLIPTLFNCVWLSWSARGDKTPYIHMNKLHEIIVCWSSTLYGYYTGNMILSELSVSLRCWGIFTEITLSRQPGLGSIVTSFSSHPPAPTG